MTCGIHVTGQYGGDSDMFYSDPWNLQQIVNNCTKTYAPVVPRPFWINTFYGAKKIKSASNIVFTNGNLDPWSGGGVLADDLKNIPGVDSSVIAFTIEGGAHHLDLRNSVPQYDPIGVVKARQIVSVVRLVALLDLSYPLLFLKIPPFACVLHCVCLYVAVCSMLITSMSGLMRVRASLIMEDHPDCPKVQRHYCGFLLVRFALHSLDYSSAITAWHDSLML